jgi:tetratricopeptide (TPR) repeat protein
VEETPRRSRRWRWAALAAVVILSVLLALAGRQLWVQRRENETPKQTEQQPVPVPHRRSVAVLGFKNISGHPDSNWLSTAFSELLTTELAAGGHLRAIPGENIARMKSDLSLPDADSFGGDTLVRIRNNLGADLVVLGSYLAVGDSQKQIRLDLRLQDASTGQMLAMMSEKGTEAQVLDLISRAGAVLRQELGFGELLAGEKMELKTSLPSNREALRFYSEGLLKLRLFDAHGARQLMEKALSLEPNYALAQAALAAAWSTLGYDAKATQAARRAVDLSARLPREQRLLIEGRYRVITREWPKAVEIYRSLFDFFRDNLDYGLHLATTQSSSGDGKGALATIDLLRKLPEPAQHDPRIDLAESLAAGTLSDFGRSQEAAARAVASGELKGARSLVAQGCLLQGQAYWKLGTLALATQSFERAQKLYAAAGDRWGVANAVLNQGVILSDQGDLSAARQSFAKALATYRQIGNHKGIASVLASTAILLRRQADLVGAMQNYREALKIYREIGDHANAAVTLNNLANLHGELGQVADARKVYEEALSIFRELGNRNAAGTVLGNLGDLLAEEGDPKKAKLHYQDSLEIFQQIGNRSSAASMLAHLGDLMALEGDLQTARGKHEEALNIRKGLGERGSVAESQASLARLAVPEKRFTDAEALCRAALEEFRREGRTDDEAAARTVLARSLLGQGKSVESQNEINHAAYLAKSSQNRSVQITVSLASASIHAALGRSGEAVKTLEEALVEARKSGLTSLQFEARLALGETEIAGGRPEAGRLRLAALEKEATALGYRFIAQKAAAANR